MERFFRRLALCIAVTSASLLSGCIDPIPVVAPKSGQVDTQMPVVPAQRIVVPVAVPVVPRVVPPLVVPEQVVPANTCNLFGTDCPSQNGGSGGDDGGGIEPWE